MGRLAEDNRNKQEFLCKKCGYKANADYNASINISRAPVNDPIVANKKLLSCKPSPLGEGS